MLPQRKPARIGDVAAESRDLFYDPGTQIRVFFLRHQENRLDACFQFPIHQRHLKFEFEIGDGAKPANHRRRFLRDGKIDEQSIERRYLHVVAVADRFLQKVEPLLEGEEWLFLIVVRDGHDDFVEKFAGAFDDIEVTVCHGIKAAGINRASSHGREIRRGKRN